MRVTLIVKIGMLSSGEPSKVFSIVQKTKLFAYLKITHTSVNHPNASTKDLSGVGLPIITC